MKDLTYTEIANKIQEEDIMVGKYYIAANIDIFLSSGYGGLKNKYFDQICGLCYEAYIGSDASLDEVLTAMRHLIDQKPLSDITLDDLYKKIAWLQYNNGEEY